MGTDIRDETARGLLGEMPTGAQIVDKNGKVVHEAIGDPDSNKIILQQDWFGSGTSGGDDGGNTNPDTPTAGADYYAGSLADGEITERYLLYQRDESVAEQTGSQTVTLLRDVGSKFNMAGDGATFLIHVQKTAMNAGAKGDVTDIQLNYDPNNVAKDGYFTTTSPYPIYIKASDLATKKTLAIPINGIGESLSGKNVKAPQLNVIFNGDGTMTFESVTGYDNDGDSAGATGANYDVVVDVIATFSTQPAVAQLPSSINLFTGSASGDIALSGVSDFFENSMDGIEITMDDYMYINSPSGTPLERALVTNIVQSPIIRIPKNRLIQAINNDMTFTLIIKPSSTESLSVPMATDTNSLGSSGINWKSDGSSKYYFHEFDNSKILIRKGAISINIKPVVSVNSAAVVNSSWSWNVVKVSPYKN